MTAHISVTTQSGAKRHLALPDVGYTLCHFPCVVPAPARRRKALTQAVINRLPLCKQCAKSAAAPLAFGPRRETITLGWQTWVAARSRARTQDQRLEDYILGLIEADLGVDVRSPLEQFSDELAELRTQWGTR